MKRYGKARSTGACSLLRTRPEAREVGVDTPSRKHTPDLWDPFSFFFVAPTSRAGFWFSHKVTKTFNDRDSGDATPQG